MKATQLSIGILALCLSLFNQARAQSFLTNGLVGWYPFTDGNANDQSGNSNNTIVYGAKPAIDRFGWPSNAYVFSNRGDSILTTNSIGFPVSTNDFTVSFWVKSESLEPEIFFCNRYRFQFDFRTSQRDPAGIAQAQFYTGGALAGITPRMFWSWRQWYNLQLVRSQSTNIMIYRNGTQVSQQTTALGNKATGNLANLSFGFCSDALEILQFYGSLDDIRIYNRALSPDELQQLYQYESSPRTGLVKAVKPVFDNLSFGTNYQMQVSSDLNVWTNSGAPFTATNKSMVYPQYWDVDAWNQLSFRLQISE